MRVLIATWGWRSHFFSLVPPGWALRVAGHEVLVAGQPSMVADIVAAVLPAVGLSADLDFAEVFGGQVGRVGTAAERAAGGTAAGGGEYGDGYAVEPAITADGGVVRTPTPYSTTWSPSAASSARACSGTSPSTSPPRWPPRRSACPRCATSGARTPARSWPWTRTP